MADGAALNALLGNREILLHVQNLIVDMTKLNYAGTSFYIPTSTSGDLNGLANSAIWKNLDQARDWT